MTKLKENSTHNMSEITEKWKKTGLLEGLDYFNKSECAISLEKAYEFIVNDYIEEVEEINALYYDSFFAGSVLPIIRRLYNQEGGMAEKAPFIDMHELFTDFYEFCISNKSLYDELNNSLGQDGEAKFCELYTIKFIELHNI